jgi:hypothetical protein
MVFKMTLGKVYPEITIPETYAKLVARIGQLQFDLSSIETQLKAKEKIEDPATVNWKHKIMTARRFKEFELESLQEYKQHQHKAYEKFTVIVPQLIKMLEDLELTTDEAILLEQLRSFA